MVQVHEQGNEYMQHFSLHLGNIFLYDHVHFIWNTDNNCTVNFFGFTAQLHGALYRAENNLYHLVQLQLYVCAVV